MTRRWCAEVEIEGTGTAATQVRRLDVRRDQLLVCADSVIDLYICVGQVRNWFTFEHLLMRWK